MFKRFYKVFSLLLGFIICSNVLSVPAYAKTGISWEEGGVWGTVVSWLAGSQGYDMLMGTDHSGNYAVNKPQNYYTTPTSSVEDKYGNVTNYYRSGDTTNTKIIDSYNKTFNTIHNTTNNTTTNNYKANIRLSDFLNNYTTNNVTNNNTYSANFKSWYYDNTTNNYTYNEFNKNDYTQNNLYYNQDNSRYYISIDNSTDEYYLIDVQYSPTFVTVNYTYNTTNNKYDKDVGDVTNVYYYELKDGRNSSTLTASEVAGLDLGYDVANYELVTDDPNTLSLQHFDGDYSDSSTYNRTFYSQNRSTTYVDSGAFGKAVSLPNGSAAGVTIPGLSDYDSLSFDFRVYYNNISSLGVYFGDTNIFQEVVPGVRRWVGQDVYTDNGGTAFSSTGGAMYLRQPVVVGNHYSRDYLLSIFDTHGGFDFSFRDFSTAYQSQMSIPSDYLTPGFVGESSYIKKYGWMAYSNRAPSLYLNQVYADMRITFCEQSHWWDTGATVYRAGCVFRHYTDKEYRWSPSQCILADFSYDSYRNQWVSMRVTLSGGNLYYFVNGDLVGSGPFTKPAADKFYIKSSGAVYLDELRVTTGSLSSAEAYNPANAPYDTNKALALPDNLSANTIYVQHNTPVTSFRIGGVRPSNPVSGFFYIPLHADYTGGQPQLYTDGNWVDVTAMVYDGSSAQSALGFTFSPVGSAPDVDTDLEPGRPTKPGQEVDPDTCSHKWEVTGGIKPTCTLPGSAAYTCSKCNAEKTEALPKLGHTWEVKQSVQTSYDEQGNILTQGFTIYRCSLCGEEYKDTDGSGPPGGPPAAPGDEDEEGGGFLSWLLGKIGELLGAVGGGIISFLQTALGKIFDGLISLVTMAVEKLTQLVNLFGSFGDAMGVLWTWLPSEVMLVLVAGVTVFVFIALLKLFLK